jgi:hypothetical protein
MAPRIEAILHHNQVTVTGSDEDSALLTLRLTQTRR